MLCIGAFIDGTRGSAGLLLLPPAGLWVLRLLRSSRITLAAQIALATGVGAVETAVVLLGCACVGVRWNLVIVLVPAVVGGAIGSPALLSLLNGRIRFESIRLSALAWISVGAAALAVLGFALLTARGTSVDYLYFWGAKGFRFASARTIDTAFLSRPDHLLMHPDYPPLVPLLYAYCSLLGGASWWTGLATTWFFVFCSALAVWGFLSGRFRSTVAAEMSALGCLILALGILVPFSGGNAEGILVFFVTVTLGLLTCLPRGETDWLVAAMLAGATLTKLEGGIFSGFVVLVYGFQVERGGAGRGEAGRWRSLIRLGSGPALALGLWLAFALRGHLLSVYRHPYSRFSLGYLPMALRAMVRSADYGALYLPWVAVAILWLSAPHRSEGRHAILVGILYCGFAIFSYLHPDQYSVAFIPASSARVLLVALICLFFAGVASMRIDPRQTRPSG